MKIQRSFQLKVAAKLTAKLDQADRCTACLVRPWVNCAVELISHVSSLELITSSRLLHFLFLVRFLRVTYHWKAGNMLFSTICHT